MAQRWNSSRAGEAAQAHAFETMMSLQVRKAHLDLVTLVAEFLAGRPDKREYSCQLGSHPGNAGSVDFTINIAESDFRYTQQETPMNNNRGFAWSWWYLLLLAQFVPTLWVPFYNSVEPSWAGIPFFYWFQMALVLVSAAVTAIVYFATERAG